MAARLRHFARARRRRQRDAEDAFDRFAAISGSMSAIDVPLVEAGDRRRGSRCCRSPSRRAARSDRRSGGRRSSCRSSRTPPAAARAARLCTSRPSMTSAHRRSGAAGADRACRSVNVTSNWRTAVVSKKLPREAQPAERADLGGEGLAGQRVGLDRRRLAGLQVVAIGLVDLGAHFHLAGLDDVGDGAAGEGGVALRGTRAAPGRRRSPPAASRFSLTATTPSNGAFTTRLSMIDCARCIASCALLRCSRTTASAASFVAERDFTSCSSCASRRALPRSVSTFFCASIAPMRSLAGAVELAAADVVARGQQRHFILRRLHGRVGLHLDDLLLGFGQIRLRLLERELLVGGIDLEDDVARFHGGAGRQQLDECGACRRPAARPASRCGRRAARRSRRP